MTGSKEGVVINLLLLVMGSLGSIVLLLLLDGRLSWTIA
jgi:hypothetical protein